jgi:hypothetical protein
MCSSCFLLFLPSLESAAADRAVCCAGSGTWKETVVKDALDEAPSHKTSGPRRDAYRQATRPRYPCTWSATCHNLCSPSTPDNRWNLSWVSHQTHSLATPWQIIPHLEEQETSQQQEDISDKCRRFWRRELTVASDDFSIICLESDSRTRYEEFVQTVGSSFSFHVPRSYSSAGHAETKLA